MFDAEDAAEELKSIAGYLREIASFNRREELGEVLADPEHRRVFELTDGDTTAEDIAAHDNVTKSARTVRRWWKKWRELGLVEGTDEFPRRRYSTFVLDLDEEA